MNSIQGNGSTLHVVGECVNRIGKVYFSDPKTGEQQKIAECLTSIDDQLNAQACKIDTLKQHKQGLLQQLFPPLESQ